MEGISKDIDLQVAFREFSELIRDDDQFYLWIIQEKMGRKLSNMELAGSFIKEITYRRASARFKALYDKFKIAYDTLKEIDPQESFFCKNKTDRFEEVFNDQRSQS